MTVRTLVIVDDDIDHALIVRLVMNQLDPSVNVDVMTDPRDLARRLVEVAPDAVVLIDRNLGGYSGLEFVRGLAISRRDVFPVLVSAALDEHERTEALRAGATAAFQKPSTLAEWRALLVSLGLGPAWTSTPLRAA